MKIKITPLRVALVLGGVYVYKTLGNPEMIKRFNARLKATNARIEEKAVEAVIEKKEREAREEKFGPAAKEIFQNLNGDGATIEQQIRMAMSGLSSIPKDKREEILDAGIEAVLYGDEVQTRIRKVAGELAKATGTSVEEAIKSMTAILKGVGGEFNKEVLFRTSLDDEIFGDPKTPNVRGIRPSFVGFDEVNKHLREGRVRVKLSDYDKIRDQAADEEFQEKIQKISEELKRERDEHPSGFDFDDIIQFFTPQTDEDL